MTVNYIPQGYHHITPYLTVNRASEAIEFYKKAFGATEVMRFEQDGILGHAEIQIADCRIMLGEEMPQWGNKSPLTLGGSPAGLHIYVKDVDQAFAQAVKAGARAEHPVSDMFYGDRSGNLVDPFGHRWTLATHKEDVSPDELQRRFREFMASMSQAPGTTSPAAEHAQAL
jgi:PhnB protein